MLKALSGKSCSKESSQFCLNQHLVKVVGHEIPLLLSVWGYTIYLPRDRTFCTLCSHLWECLSQFYLPGKLLNMKQICYYPFLITKHCHAYKTFKHHRHAINADNPFKTLIRCIYGYLEIGWQGTALSIQLVNSAQNAFLIPSLRAPCSLLTSRCLVSISSLQGSSP